SGDPVHADRQEDGGAGPQDPDGRAAGRGGQPRRDVRPGLDPVLRRLRRAVGRLRLASARCRRGVVTRAQPAPVAVDGGTSGRESLERTVENVLGQNVMGDFRPRDLVGAAGVLARRVVGRPTALGRAGLDLIGELGQIAAGELRLEPPPGDRRFTDPTWTTSPVYSRLLQGYLALCEAMTQYVENSSEDARQTERTQFLTAQIADAIAPSNFLLGNPAALRRAYETRGRSLVRGAGNLLSDVRKRRPIPAQVDEK